MTGRRPTSHRPMDRARKGSGLGRIDASCPHAKCPGTKVRLQSWESESVILAKAGIQKPYFSGFRVALAIASLPGMTIKICNELLRHDTNELINNSLSVVSISALKWDRTLDCLHKTHATQMSSHRLSPRRFLKSSANV